MVKWIGGCLVVVVIFVAAASWWGFRAMKDSLAPDGSAVVMIGAPPSRVFASLAHGDSVATWMARGNTVTASRHAPLVPGDTLRIQMKVMIGSAGQQLHWQVSEVEPDRLIVLRLLSDTSDVVVAIRRDSLTAVGDSTRIVSRLVSPMIDSITAAGAKTADGKSDGMMDMTSNLMLSMFRVQSKLDLLQLKARIESSCIPSKTVYC